METSEAVDLRQARRVLRTMGKRMTGQRVILLKIMRENQAHLDAEELYQLARKRVPHINRATVYRNLAALRESGLIETSYLGQMHPRGHFELVPDAEHYHFRCLRCGAVTEFESPLVHKLKLNVAHKLGAILSNTTLSFEGTCSSCRESQGRV